MADLRVLLASERTSRTRRLAAALVSLAVLLPAALMTATVGQAASYVPISGAGSTWSQNALDQWIRNVNQYGLKVNYAGTGSSDGRNQFRNGTVDFGVSEIPYGLKDGGVIDDPPTRKYAYMPIVAGGTAFMYNLTINGQRVTNLRLSGNNLALIFTGGITMWNDSRVAADNPGLVLPARRVVPVVRSDGSGTTAQLTTWLSKKYPAPWDAYCQKAGRATPCGVTSNFPVAPGAGFVAQAGSLGVSGYVAQAQSEGAITYVEYSYALNARFPIVKMLNAAGYYIEPTAPSVAVGLLGARINTDASSSSYLTQILDGVYDNPDPRTYPLSSYSYMIVPTAVSGTFSEAKGKTLGDFAYYFLCEGQQQAPVLGYSPLPINLVQAGFDQIKRIPGVNVQSIDITKCHNPTFSADGTNTLAKTAPQPSACDKQGAAAQCGTGTGGAKQPTKVTTHPSTTATPTKGGSSPSGGASSPAGSGTGTRSPPSSPGSTPATSVDPDTGQAVQAVGTGTDAGGGSTSVNGQLVGAVPVATPIGDGTGLQTALMILAASLLLAVTVVPPLVARLAASRAKK